MRQCVNDVNIVALTHFSVVALIFTYLLINYGSFPELNQSPYRNRVEDLSITVQGGYAEPRSADG